MKTKLFTFVILFAVSLTAYSQRKVAVYVIGENAGINKVLEGKLVNALSGSGKYKAIERTSAFLTELSREQKYQRSGAVDDNEISRLGRQFGVQYVCVAEIFDALGEKYITARLIDVETAEVANSHGVGGEMNNMNDCLRIANEIATNLSKGSFAEQAQKDEEERIASFRREYLDLGLPSGTLWKATNESDYYTFNEAVSKYGHLLPTVEQWEELMNYCKWEWSDKDFALKVIGNDGKYFLLPPLGGRDCSGEGYNGNVSGYYWSSSLRKEEDGCYFLYGVDAAKEYHDGMIYAGKTCESYPVHLVLSDVQEGYYNEQRYVDLGLPSGTLWKSYSENGFYDYNSALNKFGDAMPSARQWSELVNFCKWEWTGHGYKIAGNNGKCIILPAMGCHSGGYDYVNIGENGFYWSSSIDSKNYEIAKGLAFNSEQFFVGTSSHFEKYSVRLVYKNK